MNYYAIGQAVAMQKSAMSLSGANVKKMIGSAGRKTAKQVKTHGVDMQRMLITKAKKSLFKKLLSKAIGLV